ncbi:MAG: translesion error-prone DNA polymerase V autoproteolytic subunit [Dictyoglomaceae bacterium]|nr:translesion error-prone DNA polymerase V autoproteolytic subunit [Dictyoglomaceae bacterium]
MEIKKGKNIEEIYKFEKGKEIKLPFFISRVPAGFPSPAEDYIEKYLDLNELLIRHPSATYFVKVSGNSMIDVGIHDGDILIVDRALEPKNNDIVIAVIDGELTVKRLVFKNNKIYLYPENSNYKPIEIQSQERELLIWGIATYVIHKL